MASRLEEITEKFAADDNDGKCAEEKSAKYKAQRKRSTLTSVSGPPSWRKSEAKHREAPTIPLDPPGNEPDVTQNGKGRQCVSARFAKRATLEKISATKEFSWQTKKKCNNALAHGVSCGRLAAFTAPLFRIQGCTRCRSEEGRESYSGGRATWASFYSWSSG